jgi:hypothetical protein
MQVGRQRSTHIMSATTAVFIRAAVAARMTPLAWWVGAAAYMYAYALASMITKSKFVLKLAQIYSLSHPLQKNLKKINLEINLSCQGHL